MTFSYAYDIIIAAERMHDMFSNHLYANGNTNHMLQSDDSAPVFYYAANPVILNTIILTA